MTCINKKTSEIYAIELEDYSTPAFCSGFTRTYAGTKEQLADFIEALRKTRFAEDFQPLLEAYYTWLQNGTTGIVQHNYCRCWNIRQLEVYRITEINLPNFSMKHLNTWDCPYIFQADNMCAKIIYAKDGESWYRFVEASFQNLQMESLDGKFIPVGDCFWGHPAALKQADGITSNRLLFRERKLGSMEEMLQDLDSPAEIDFSDFVNDILGDG